MIDGRALGTWAAGVMLVIALAAFVIGGALTALVWWAL